ncbi:MAG: polysaccharide deacetylase family protein [Chloroflexota bacterium]
MNIVKYLSQSRGVGNSARRLSVISKRFGISPARMRGALRELLTVCAEYDAHPTLAVTACLIERNPYFFETLASRGADLGVHGFVHTDHALLDDDEQYEHLSRALAAFSVIGLRPKGFRHPYLRFNEDTWHAASRLEFTHASNSSVHWDVVEENLPPEALAAYYKGLQLYSSEPESQRMSLPRLVDGDILDIPASLPDDEAVLDRLALDGRHAGIFWLRTLDRTYELGEAMTLVVHNERVPMTANSLRALLRAARARKPGVWIATLSEINDWWRKRAKWQGRVEQLDDRRWRVSPPADTDATILVRDAATQPDSVPWYGRWRMMPASQPFIIHSDVAPMLSLGDAPDSARTFISGEGYSVATNGSVARALPLHTDGHFGPTAERPLSDSIERTDHPLVRLWRWPRGARSALAITSDVDAMSLVDFLRRPLEV